MPRYVKKQRFQLGDWYLQERNGVWYRCHAHYQRTPGKRISLCTRDFQEAKKKLEQFYFENSRPDKVKKEEITLAKVLTIYYSEHGSSVASDTSLRIHCEKLLEYWKDNFLSELSVARQKEFKQFLLKEGYAIGYVKRIFSTLKAAINYCYHTEYLEAPANIISISVPAHSNKEMGRPLSLDEMVSLFNTIDTDYLMRFCLLLLGTLGRTSAILELHTKQLDHDFRLIKLNPEGRAQTKKYRPTIKMPEFIHQMTCNMHNCNVVTGSTKQIYSVKKSFATAVKRSGLEGRVTAYSFRHTMTRWLRSQSVPPWEVAAQLGHRMEQYSTTEIYAPYDPAYLVNCVKAIEGYFEALSKQSMAVQNFVTN